MKFAQLKDYLSKKILIQHVYQPLMIKTLLESKDNMASVYITKVMPGRILRSHNVVRLELGKFIMNLERDLTAAEKRELVALCNSKIAGYEQKYGVLRERLTSTLIARGFGWEGSSRLKIRNTMILYQSH